MQQRLIFALAIAALGVSLLGGCSNNKAASAMCGTSTDTTTCESCCKANGASGYKFVGAGTCGCLGGSSASHPVAAAPASALAPAGGPVADFAGNYKSNWGPTVFSQSGPRVVATYATGNMTCMAAGSTLDCNWHDGGAFGKATLTKDTTGAIKGTWGNRNSATDGGDWLFSP